MSLYKSALGLYGRFLFFFTPPGRFVSAGRSARNWHGFSYLPIIFNVHTIQYHQETN